MWHDQWSHSEKTEGALEEAQKKPKKTAPDAGKMITQSRASEVERWLYKP
jgi:hypothetical protein